MSKTMVSLEKDPDEVVTRRILQDELKEVLKNYPTKSDMQKAFEKFRQEMAGMFEYQNDIFDENDG